MAGFNQNALEQMALQGDSNSQLEVNGEEGLDLVEEFYTNETENEDVGNCRLKTDY